MKLSFIVAGLFSAMAVKASFYEFTFEDAAIAKNCLKINYDYINKVSTDYYRREHRIYLANHSKKCSKALQDNITEVCGHVETIRCSE